MHDAKLHTGRRYERHDKHSADRDQQSADLTANRAGLEAESDKLLAAHFADAIDLGALKRHQDRIRAGLADIERRLTSATDRLPTASSDAHASPNRSRPSSPNQSRNDLQEHPPSSDVTGSRKTLWVDLGGALSKLAPPLARMAAAHREIRRRTRRLDRRTVLDIRQQVRLSEDALLAAETRYRAGATLREIAADLGVSRPRLSCLLRERGVRLRRRPPSSAEVAEMRCRYAAGESLERVGSRLGFSAGTVRSWLLDEGVVMRDSHGREQ